MAKKNEIAQAKSVKPGSKLAKAIVGLYWVRAASSKIKELEVSFKAEIEKATTDGKLSFNGLDVSVTQQSRKEVNPTKAQGVLRQRMTDDTFEDRFVDVKIKLKPGAKKPPKALLKQLAEYFDFSEEVNISSDRLKEAVATGLLTEDDVAQCMEEKTSYAVIRTPTKIADAVLLARPDAPKLIGE